MMNIYQVTFTWDSDQQMSAIVTALNQFDAKVLITESCPDYKVDFVEVIGISVLQESKILVMEPL